MIIDDWIIFTFCCIIVQLENNRKDKSDLNLLRYDSKITERDLQLILTLNKGGNESDRRQNDNRERRITSIFIIGWLLTADFALNKRLVCRFQTKIAAIILMWRCAAGVIFPLPLSLPVSLPPQLPPQPFPALPYTIFHYSFIGEWIKREWKKRGTFDQQRVKCDDNSICGYESICFE